MAVPGSSADEASPGTTPPLLKAILEQTTLGRECVNKEDYQGALERFQSALEKAETLSDNQHPKLKFACLLNLGACLVSSGKPGRGLNMLETALALLESEQGNSNCEEAEEAESQIITEGSKADLHYNIGMAAQVLGDCERAVEGFKHSVAEHMKSGDKKQAAEVFHTLANCHQQSRQYDSQIACLLSAQRLLEEEGEEEREALVCADLAMTYYTAGRDEECKQMLTTAKMMSLGLMKDTRIQGQLHYRIGVVHSNLGMHREAVESFERALPLVRMSGGQGEAEALNMEAAILQNIGAVHNERANYTDAVIYSMAAAKLNGKVGNIDAEAKCFCNLAFAQTQLKNFPSAAEHYSCSLLKAQSSGNLLLQFQAHEGLASVGYSTNQYNRAVTCFKQALMVLEKVNDDTGIDRERVMEKLSDATLAMKRQQSEGRTPVRKHVKVRKAVHRSRSDGESSVDHPDTTPTVRHKTAGRVAPLPNRASATQPSTSRGLDSSYDQVQALYMETLGSNTTPLSSSISTLASLSSSSSAPSNNPLGASIFSRDQLHTPLPLTTGRWASSRLSEVPEGSLALGLDTRQQYTTVEVDEQDTGTRKKGAKRKRKKGRKARKIVPLNSNNQQQQQQQPPPASQPPSQPSQEQRTRSSACIIL